MKNLLLIIISTITFSFFNNTSIAQGKFSYHFGPAFPSGKFADDDYDDIWLSSGGASIGGVLGIKYDYPLNNRGLSLFAGLDANIFGLNRDIRDEIEDDSDDEITFPKYLIFPVTGGLNYKYKVNDKLTLFGEGGVAAGLLKITDLIEEIENEELTRTFDLAINPGYKIGAGIIINDKLEIGISHFQFGKYTVDNEINFDHETEKLEDVLIRVEYTVLTLGFNF